MFDFIVVGAGPAGASAASRLARTKAAPNVLLLEAGPAGHDDNPYLLSERWTSFMQYPEYNWGYKTTPQRYLNDRVLDYSRGKGLGGSSSINFCAYTSGPKDDYDRWAEEVCDPAFNWESALRQRQKIECWDNDLSDEYREYASPDMSTHGTRGAVRIEYPKLWETPVKTHLEAAKSCGLGLNLDGNNGNPLGLACVPATSHNGRRVTSATAYLSDIPKNLTIEAQAQVTKVVFEGRNAVGIIANGKEYRATKEVILSAGAVDTPKLLMLSGIGDRDELAKFDIESIHHLPGVGNNLQDHFFTSASWRVTDGLTDWSKIYSDPEKVKKAHKQFAKDGTGPMALFFHGLALGFFKSDEVAKSKEFADLSKDWQEHVKKPNVPVWEMSTHAPPLTSLADPQLTYLTVVIFTHCPQSRGTIRLASKDPTVAPLSDPNFFSHAFDRRCAIAATKGMLDFVDTPAIKKDIIEPLTAPKSRSDEDLLALWRDNGQTTWHPSCTAKMGKKDDQMACLDSDFRVYGVESLRVVDMSAAPFLPNCHVQSIAYFIGETAAEKMIAEYGLGD